MGHYLASEFREIPREDSDPAGRLMMWARVFDETATTAAKLGFLADMVPLAICDAAGVMGAGTSLDNSLRVGHLVDCDWILLDLRGQLAHEGYGYGEAHCWSPDGTLLGTGTQTAKLFSFEQRFGTESPWA
jgi:acyl-CoA thioesterase